MGAFKNVLLAVDFHADNQQVIDKAVQVAEMNDAVLHLIHVVEPLAYAYTDGMTTWGEEMVSLEAAIREDARKKMQELSAKLNIAAANSYFRTGKSSEEIHAAAKDNSIDLIILGTHGQAGLQLLLGSTANSVLHGSSCDVLAVRIKEN
jgi:universal stress protein A